ncbi:hypothetical protein INS49_012582 [Diaporthe citri]|uniref:uncharacterized protein n=1 Tax=Diaporthe citri TaxID=83186 RepID=UPI001C7E6E07|nr:uncharacterized protein INS49_012582 [Diaporthe citri]KAG6359062.1 hypothetical protein INS49_012582 [Diaporthe citri]
MSSVSEQQAKVCHLFYHTRTKVGLHGPQAVVKPCPNGGRSTVHNNRTYQDYNGTPGTDVRTAIAMCHYNITGRVCDIAINLATRHKPIGALDWQSPSLTTSAADPTAYALHRRGERQALTSRYDITKMETETIYKTFLDWDPTKSEEGGLPPHTRGRDRD